MILIKGEHFNTGSNLFDHVKIPNDILIAVLSGAYDEGDCDNFEDFLGYLEDESILVYIEKEGE
ncbi:hypothetical protein [Gemella sp.]